MNINTHFKRESKIMFGIFVLPLMIGILASFIIPYFMTPPHLKLIGIWKSDEQKTIVSINNVDGVTEAARDVFENNFFGALFVEYKYDQFRSRLENDYGLAKGFADDELQDWLPYEVITSDLSYLDIKRFNSLLNKYEVNRLYWEGDCYYVLVSKWEFKEYFCRVTD